MNIFSKWFGSKDTEEQKVKILEEVCFKDAEQDEIRPDPQYLPEAMRYVVQKWGMDYLQNTSSKACHSEYAGKWLYWANTTSN